MPVRYLFNKSIVVLYSMVLYNTLNMAEVEEVANLTSYNYGESNACSRLL